MTKPNDIHRLKLANNLLKTMLYKNDDFYVPLYRNFQINENKRQIYDYFQNIIEKYKSLVDTDTNSNSEWILPNLLPFDDVLKFVNHSYHMNYIKICKDFELPSYHYYYDGESSDGINLLILYHSNSHKEDYELVIKSNKISYTLTPYHYQIINSSNILEFPIISNDIIHHIFIIPLNSHYNHPIKVYRHTNTSHTYDAQVQMSLKNRLLYQCYNSMDLKHYMVIRNFIENMILRESILLKQSVDNSYPNQKINESDIHPTFWPNIHCKEYTCTSHMCYVEDQDLYTVSENYILLHSELIRIFDLVRNYHEYTNLENIHMIHLLIDGMYVLKNTEHVNGIYILTNHTNNTLIIYDSQLQCNPYEFKPYASILFKLSEKDMVIVYNPTNNKSILTRYMYI